MEIRKSGNQESMKPKSQSAREMENQFSWSHGLLDS
jgi:hypothetical protein